MVARGGARRQSRGRAHDRNGHRGRNRAGGKDLSGGVGRRGRDRPHVHRIQRPALQVRQRRLPRGLRVGARDCRPGGRGNRTRRRNLPPALCEGRFDQDHRADRVRSGARRRRIRVGGGARNGEVPRDRRRQYRQYLQPRGGGDLRGRDAGRREAVRAAPQRSEAPRVQARRRRVPHRARGAHRNGGRVRRRGRVRPAHLGNGVKRLGVIGSMVWDTSYGRDSTRRADWRVVPLVKVGRDLAARANEFLGSLRHVAPSARFLEVPAPNNRVTLRYLQAERRCEQMSGGVPPWTWPELGAQVRDLDALYVNFISGYEMDLQTAQLLRRGFPRFLYADLHSLFLGKEPDGTRVPQPLPDAPAWFSCFDVVQLNEEELAQLGPDPLIVAAGALARGCQTLVVTLGPRGAAYFTGRPVRSARIASDPAPDSEGDPTGCGDVLGATVVASLAAGAPLAEAVRLGTHMGARNVTR